jgi:hypothetical protein
MALWGAVLFGPAAPLTGVFCRIMTRIAPLGGGCMLLFAQETTVTDKVAAAEFGILITIAESRSMIGREETNVGPNSSVRRAR